MRLFCLIILATLLLNAYVMCAGIHAVLAPIEKLHSLGVGAMVQLCTLLSACLQHMEALPVHI